MTFLIWSHEHEMWWRPNWQGYTSKISEAGHYEANTAANIVLDHVPPGEEVAVEISIAPQYERMLRDQSKLLRGVHP